MGNRWIFGGIALLLLLMSITSLRKQCKQDKENKRPFTTFDEENFSFQFLRTLGYTAYQAADIGECFTTAQKINNGDTESWHKEWLKTADRIHGIANEALLKGHLESAKEAYLRASNYYRTAEFYLHGDKNDPRILGAYRKCRSCFSRVVELTEAMEAVEIPYRETTLPGYFYKASIDGHKQPTIIMQTGFDGLQEELYSYAMAANKRGYNVLTFEGPGQGRVIREQRLPFKPDWETIITPVIDFALQRSDVDSEKLVLYGISLGGYFAPRGASFDKRVKALIANSGVYDVLDGIIDSNKKIYQSRETFLNLIHSNPHAFNETVKSLMKDNLLMRWFMENGMYTFDAKTPTEFMLHYVQFSLKNHAHRISCPTLICESEHEFYAL